MADLIELDLVVRDKGLKDSISTVERLERQIIKAAKAVDQNSISQVRYNKILLSTKREYKELGLSSQKATSTVRAFAAAQRKATAEAAKENKVRVEQIKLYKQARAEAERENQSRSNSIKEQVRQEASLERLRAKYKPLYAASKQYETALNEINQAHKLGVISIGQQTAAVDRLNSEYKQGTGIFSQYSAQARRGTNQLGVAVQQTGYQVGDFLVQVQSGTNPLVAFGQQATQLVGILPLVATQLGLTAMAAIGISTALGIGIPLVTALGAAFMRTKKPAQNLEEIMSDLSSAVGDYSSNMESASLSTDDLNSKFGAFGDTAKGVLETMLEISRVKIQESVQAVSALGPLSPKALQSISESGTLQTVQQDVVSEMFPVIKTLLGKMSTRNDGRGMAAEFATMLINLEKSEGTDKQLAVLEEISQFTLDVGGQYEDMTDRQKEFFDKVTEAQDLLLKAVEAEQAVVLRAQEDKKKVMLRNHNIMLAWQKQIGDGQAERDKDKAEALEQEKKTVIRNAKIMESWGKQIGRGQEERDKAKAAAEEDSIRTLIRNAKIMESWGKQIGQGQKERDKAALESDNEKTQAQVDNVDALLKAGIEAHEARLKMIRDENDELVYFNNIMLAWQKQIGRGQEERDKPGPKGPKLTTMEGPIKALQRQIELSEALFGLQGTARREEEIYMQLKFQNQDVDIKAGKEELELLAERVALEEQRTKAEQMNLKNISPLKKYVAEYAKLVKLKDSGLGDEAFAKEVAKLNEELAKSNPLLNSFTDAFADFLGRGARDFKSFAKDILNDFKSMLIQMITTAARNKIMFSMGMGGGALGTAAAAGGGGTGSSIANLGVLGNAVSSFAGSGIASGFSSALGLGGYASQGLFNVAANAQVAAAAGANAMAASIGAAIPPLLAVAAAFSFLRTRTKELDSGLRVTVDNMDVLVKSFKTIQKSRFWGLSKKVRTSEEEASSDISDPIVDAVFTIQESVMEAASAFGVASDKFNDFTYDFEVSLKGLTEDQKMEKLNEEFTKLGDTFTEMSELFTSMNDLLAVYQQRLELEKQLLVAQGDVVKLREQELETIHVLNRDLATRLHLLQAEGDTQSALTAFASGISEQQGIIRRAVDALVKPLQDAIDRTRTQAEKSYSIFKTAADKSADSAKNIVDIITSALDSRTIISESAELMRYQTAQKQLASFAGGAEFDEASLRKATEGVSIDSQKFFGSFEDYARDFYRTQINLEDLAAVAEKELSDVEQQIDIAQKAYEVAMGTHQEAVDLNTAIETLAQDLNIYEATKLANEPLIKMVQDEGNRQIELLDSILVETTKQVNTQLGIESSMADLVGNTMSIGEAMGVLGLEAESLAGGVLALEDIERDINGNVTDLGLYVVDFEGAVEKLDTSVFDLTGTVDDLDGDIKTLFDNINLLDGGIDDFGVKVDGLGVSTDNLGIDITSLGATLSSAMSSLGSIVSGLSSAVSGLASSNNNLAAAQQKAASAAKISTLTTNAAGIAAEISSIESSAGTTAAGATPTQESQLAILKQDLLEEQSKDGADRNLGTAHFNTLINNLNKEIATQVVAAELSSEDSARLALLSGNLETMRQEVTALGETPTFATGGYHSGGMRLVGENGPELEATGPSRIYSAQQTRNMLSGGSGEVVVELRSLRREVSELKAEQRKVGVENVKYNKKSYDLYREWDTVGLPATRTA
tara:strand:+ start:590 stop:5665 length:5076 start_codon:yes stop_codon:yes gene_type:complete